MTVEIAVGDCWEEGVGELNWRFGLGMTSRLRVFKNWGLGDLKMVEIEIRWRD